MSSTLILHRGARAVDRSALALVPTPEATATWFPVAHSAVIDAVEAQLDSAGFTVAKARFGLSSDNGRLFAALDLRSELAAGVSLSVGVRNSIDKSLPLGFVAGSRTFVCDNLSFQSELLVARKHTRFGEERFVEAISLAVGKLGAFQQNEARRIEDLRGRELGDRDAESLILRAFEQGIVSTRNLAEVIREWRQPSYEEFRPRNALSLYNSFTTVLRERALTNPQQHAALTIRLGGLFGTDGATETGLVLAGEQDVVEVEAEILA
jgi:hypothetical protein